MGLKGLVTEEFWMRTQDQVGDGQAVAEFNNIRSLPTLTFTTSCQSSYAL